MFKYFKNKSIKNYIQYGKSENSRYLNTFTQVGRYFTTLGVVEFN